MIEPRGDSLADGSSDIGISHTPRFVVLGGIEFPSYYSLVGLMPLRRFCRCPAVTDVFLGAK
jgi:hypothetical protein